MKLVILDTFASTGGELNYERLSSLVDLTCYDRTAYDQIVERIGDAELVITNKCLLDRAILEQCPNLQYIGIIATGYNNVDMQAARERGIVVTNVPAYSTKGVAQLVFAYILDAYSMVCAHDKRVKNGEWERCPDFCFYDTRIQELDGKTIGLFGFGSIAKRVASIAQAFDMKVLVHTRTVREEDQKAFPQVRFVDLETVLRESDIVSVHCPLTEQTEGMMNEERFRMMKPTAIFINTARGPIVKEADLRRALEEGLIAAAYVDVVSAEPIHPDNPLMGAPNMTITPHIAWAARDTRIRLIDMVCENVKAYLSGHPIHRVD